MNYLRVVGNAFAERVAILRENIGTVTNLLAEDVLEVVFAKLCKMWNIERHAVIPTSLHLLAMTLEDPDNHDVSTLLHTLLSVDPLMVLETFAGMHEDERERRHIRPEIRRETPRDLPELRQIIRAAALNQQKIKAVSTNYSGLWTDIGGSTGIIIDTSSLTNELPNECLKNVDNEGVYHKFEAGITMNEIQLQLWPLRDRATQNPEKYRVLENVTSGAGLSLAGTVTTGAHGNGLNLGNVADAVVSFQMFTIDSEWKVKRYQIEKQSDPITDPRAFNMKYRPNEDNDFFELIQDDELFNASVVNIGCMGVVYSYVLRTVKGFYLEEERKLHKWSEAKNIIRDLYVDPNIYNFQIIGSPYAYKLSPRENNEHRVLISVLKKTKAVRISKRPGPSLNVPMELIDKALVAAGNSTPHLVPVVMHFSLLYLQHTTLVLNAVDALNTLAGIVATEFSGVRSSECAMRSSGAETVIEIMEDLHELYSDIRKSNNRQLVNVPIALRFTSKSDNYMAMEYDCHRPTITIEQSIINGTLGADDTLRKFRKRMLKNFQGRPHWGLLHELDAEKVKKLYDANCRQKFNSALERFDPNRVFENEFADFVFGKERRKLNNE